MEKKHNNVIKEMGKYMKISDRYKRMYRTIFETGTEQTKDLLNKKCLRYMKQQQYRDRLQRFRN